MTLCLIEQESKVLLGMKKRGFGKGRWNGFGGKVSDGESIEDAARREISEECGVTISNLEKRGVIEFCFEKNPDEVLEVHIFNIKDFSGTPTETEEMKPEWFTTDSIPYDAMWPDDVYWMPLFFEGKRFRGSFFFGENDSILESSLVEVDEV